MKRLFFILSFLAPTLLNAQQSPIMVCNAAGTTCLPYFSLDTAITYAQSGDYIYLPGGSFTITDTLNKELHIIGAGHYPDSTQVTFQTLIGSGIYLGNGFSNSSIEGVYIQGKITISGSNVQNLQIKRSHFGDGVYAGTGIDAINNGALYNSIFSQNIIVGSVNLPITANCVITNCIIDCIIHFYSSTIQNSVFFTAQLIGCGNVHGSIFNMTNCTVDNCIFYGIMGNVWNFPSYCWFNNSNNLFTNNLTTQASSSGIGGIETGTITNIPISSIFVNVPTAGFDYTKDFHSLSPYTNLGIYGGTTPYKEGAVPSNPHIYLNNINGVTNTNGDLQVQLKVRAEY